jgi:gliding motility-associated-like protein
VTVTLSFFPESVGSLDTMTCLGGSITYEGEVFDANRLTGDVILSGTGPNGCDNRVTVTLSFFQESVGTLDTMTCFGGSIVYEGEIFDASRTTGDVVLPGADVNGCDSTVAVTLSFFPQSVGSFDTVACVGSSITYAGQVFDANRTMDEVVLPGVDVNGCDSIVSVSLTFFAPAFSALDTIICVGTNFIFFSETFGANRLTGEVIVPTPAANGCDSTVRVTVGFFPQPAGVVDTTICAGTIFTYGGRDFDAAVSGELVTLPTPSVNGCDSVVAVTVRLLELPTVTLSGNGVVCADGQLTFQLTYDGPGTAAASLSYDPQDILPLNPGVNEFTRNVPPGTRVFILEAMGGVACNPVTSGEINVVQTDLAVELQVTSGDGIFAVSCADGNDGSLVAIASGGQPPFSYGWDDGSVGDERQRLTTGTYTVTVTSGRGCTIGGAVTLTAPEVLVASIGTLPATCVDSLPALVITDLQGGVGPYVLSTDPTGGFRPVIAFPDTVKVAPGLTLLQLEDANGCLLEETFDLAGPPNSAITLTPARPVISQGDSVEITINSELDLAGYTLIPGPEGVQAGNSFFVGPLQTTTYLVAVVDSAGCAASAMVEVIIDDFVPVYAPTAFSPNEDGVNDAFRIYAKPVVVAFSNFNIYDRWGNLIYMLDGPIDPQDATWGWDGKNASGQVHESAVYVYSIDVLLMGGRTVTVKSDMVLMR